MSILWDTKLLDRVFDNNNDNFDWWTKQVRTTSTLQTWTKTDTGYTIDVELAGHTKDSVDLRVSGDTLYIHTKTGQRSKDVKLFIPIDSNIDEVSAKMENGLLTLTVPFILTKTKTKKVRIE